MKLMFEWWNKLDYKYYIIISACHPFLSIETIDNCYNKFLEQMVNLSVVYYNDMIKAKKVYRAPNVKEEKAVKELVLSLKNADEHSTPEDIQKIIFSIGKDNQYENLRDWFRSLYEILLGQSEGPRMGSFIHLFGISETITLINNALTGKLK